MELVRDWGRQTARATGAALIAPVLLLAATIVAAGGGLGGLGSLGEITGGPSVPETGLAQAPQASLADAEIVAADLSGAAATAPFAAGPGDVFAPTVPGASPGPGPVGRVDDPRSSPGPSPPAAEPGGPPPSAPVTPIVPPAAPAPVDDLIDETREIGESLPGPLGPTTGDILDSLLGPR